MLVCRIIWTFWGIPPDGLWLNLEGAHFYFVAGARNGNNRGQAGYGTCSYDGDPWRGAPQVGVSNKYTPDGIWWETTYATERLYPCLGGNNRYSRGNLNGPQTRWFSWVWKADWGFGASTALQYTPDALWWYTTAKGYARSGGRTGQESECGSFGVSPRDTARYKDWHIGASLQIVSGLMSLINIIFLAVDKLVGDRTVVLRHFVSILSPFGMLAV